VKSHDTGTRSHEDASKHFEELLLRFNGIRTVEGKDAFLSYDYLEAPEIGDRINKIYRAW